MKTFGLFLIVFLYILTSSGDYQDSLEEGKFYCKMVKQGKWPNYENRVCLAQSE